MVLIALLIFIACTVALVFVLRLLPQPKEQFVSEARELTLVKRYAERFSLSDQPYEELPALKYLLDQEGKFYDMHVLRRAVQLEMRLIREARETTYVTARQQREHRQAHEKALKLVRELGLRGETEQTDSKDRNVEPCPDRGRITMQDLVEMDEDCFQSFVENLFEEIGYHTELIQPASDGGIIVLVKKTDGKLIAYASNHFTVVDLPSVRMLVQLRDKWKCNEALALTPWDFAPGIRQFAQEAKIMLWGRNEMERLLSAFNMSPNIISDKNNQMPRGSCQEGEKM